MRDGIVLLFHRTGDSVPDIIDSLLTTLASAVEPVRPEENIQVTPNDHTENIT